jgi:hypothetical protein
MNKWTLVLEANLLAVASCSSVGITTSVICSGGTCNYLLEKAPYM